MEGELWGLAVHPVKPVICTGSDDGTVRLWDTDKHSMIDVVTNVGKAVRCVAFSHDGGALAIGMKDGRYMYCIYSPSTCMIYILVFVFEDLKNGRHILMLFVV